MTLCQTIFNFGINRQHRRFDTAKIAVTPLFLDLAIFYSCKRKLQRYHDQRSINLNIRLMYFQFNRHCSVYEPPACKIEKLCEPDFLQFPLVFVLRSEIKIKIWRTGKRSIIYVSVFANTSNYSASTFSSGQVIVGHKNHPRRIE